MPLLDHESFLQPPDSSVLAWRYIDTSKLLTLLLRRELHFTRVDLLPDKFEGTHTKPTRSVLLTYLTASAPIGAGMRIDQAESMVKHMVESPRTLRKWMYASCWHLGNHESEAMWRLYCGVKEGVAMVLPYERLRASLDDPTTYMGVVKYIDYETDVISGQNIFNLVMHKRREFQYEDEARIVCMRGTVPGRPSEDFAPAVKFPWAPADHVQRIVVSPYADSWYLDTVRELVSRIAPELHDRVVGSSMGGGPYY